MKHVSMVITAGAIALGLGACSPEVGSEAWCEKMKEKPAKQWSAEEAANYARHCLIRR